MNTMTKQQIKLELGAKTRITIAMSSWIGGKKCITLEFEENRS